MGYWPKIWDVATSKSARDAASSRLRPIAAHYVPKDHTSQPGCGTFRPQTSSARWKYLWTLFLLPASVSELSRKVWVAEISFWMQHCWRKTLVTPETRRGGACGGALLWKQSYFTTCQESHIWCWELQWCLLQCKQLPFPWIGNSMQIASNLCTFDLLK